jgi:diguanylate cyclase (GGDEF)-like protein
VLYIDVDDFKQVNDLLGHDAGDALLIAAAKRLSECVRSRDLLARLGGDEFAILVVGESGQTETSPDIAALVADRVVEAFSRPFDLGGQQVQVTVSVGLSRPAASGVDPRDLLVEADHAMYTAKRGGKGRTQVFSGETRPASPAVIMRRGPG